jgi:uncharacterized protein YdhG (YjbR/CyaY superfamily)
VWNDKENVVNAKPAAPESIDNYIAAFPNDVQAILQKIRSIIKTVLPEAAEQISYKIPSFALSGNVIYFAAFKKHIGMFPPVKGDAKLRKELTPYRGEKGNLKFPLDRPMPYTLIKRVVRARAREHLEQVRAAGLKKKVRGKAGRKK